MTNKLALDFVSNQVHTLEDSVRRRSRDIRKAEALVLSRRAALRDSYRLSRLRARTKAEQVDLDVLIRQTLSGLHVALHHARRERDALVAKQVQDRRTAAGLRVLLRAQKG